MKVRVGVTGNAVETPLFWADAKGYFTDEGLQVETTRFTSGTQEVAPLTSNQLDVGDLGPDPGTFNAVARGLDIKITGFFGLTSPKNTGLGIVVRKDLIDSGKFKDAKDFKGLQIATVSKVSSAAIYLQRALAKGNLTTDDVTQVEMPFPDMLAALTNKKVDAAIEVQPFISRLESDGTAKLVYGAGDLLPGAPQLIMVYGPDFIKSQPDAAKHYATAFLRAQRDIWRIVEKGQGSQDDLFQVVSKYTATKDKSQFDTLMKSDNLAGTDPNGRMDTTVLDQMQDFFVSVKTQQQKIDMSKVVDHTYMDYAVQQLGQVSS